MSDGVWDTDDKHPSEVLKMLRVCAASWQPGVRLLGNIRACDIVRACDAAIPALGGETPATRDMEASNG